MRRLISSALAALLLFLTASAAAQTIRNRVAPICTDVSDINSANPEGFIDCDWFKSGTSKSNPMHFRLVDQDNPVELDVEILGSLTAGMATTFHAAVTAAAMFVWDGTTFQLWSGNTTGEADVDVEMLGGNAIETDAGNAGAGTQRVTLASDDVVGAALQDDLTSDNDAAELADYFDGTSQRAPLYVDDATLTLDNESIADAIAALYDEVLETTDGTSLGDLLDDALYSGGAGGTRIADVLVSDNDAAELANYFDSTSQLAPLYVDDATLALDNEPLADVMAALYDLQGAAIATHDSGDVDTGPQLMGSAQSSQAAAVADDDAARVVLNLYGELVIAAYSWTSDAIKILEQDPISEHHTEDTLCDLTNIAQNTTDYCGYVDMDGAKTLGIHCIADTDPADTCTYTIECTIQDDGTAPAGCSYVNSTLSFVEMNGHDHNASYVDEETILISYFDIPVKYCRVKYVTSADGGNDADLTCFYKKMY